MPRKSPALVLLGHDRTPQMVNQHHSEPPLMSAYVTAP
jgi:hypothetical protein